MKEWRDVEVSPRTVLARGGWCNLCLPVLGKQVVDRFRQEAVHGGVLLDREDLQLIANLLGKMCGDWSGALPARWLAGG